MVQNDLIESTRLDGTVDEAVESLLSERERITSEFLNSPIENVSSEYEGRSRIAKSARERVFARVFSNTNRNVTPVPIDEKLLRRIVKRHNVFNLIVISAWKNGSIRKSYAESKSLLSDIKESKYRYLPIYWGYKLFFIVFNTKYAESIFSFEIDGCDFKYLIDKGKEWALKYNQKCFLVNGSVRGLKYMGCDGNEITYTARIDYMRPLSMFMEKRENVKERLKNMFIRRYNKYKETSLKNGEIPVEFPMWYDKQNSENDFIGKGWTYDIEHYENKKGSVICLNPMPACLNEAMSRTHELCYWMR